LLWVVLETIYCRTFYSLYRTRFRFYKIGWPFPDNVLVWERGPHKNEQLPQSYFPGYFENEELLHCLLWVLSRLPGEGGGIPPLPLSLQWHMLIARAEENGFICSGMAFSENSQIYRDYFLLALQYIMCTVHISRMVSTVARWLERLAVNAKVLGSIPVSSDTVESEGRQMKQCWKIT